MKTAANTVDIRDAFSLAQIQAMSEQPANNMLVKEIILGEIPESARNLASLFAHCV
jgi:hypothetical protein